MKHVQKLMLLIAVVGILVGGVFMLPRNQVSAQNSGGYRVTPLRTELTVERGQSTEFEINAKSVTGQEQLTGVSLLDFVPNQDETGSAKVIVDREAYGDNPFSLLGLVDLPDPQVISGDEEITFKIGVNIPEDTPPGSYFGVLQVRPGSDKDFGDEDGGAVGLSATVGSLLLVTVPGDTVELLSLEQLSASREGKLGSFFSSSPDAIAIRVKNEGNVFSKPFGNIILKDWRDNVIQEFEINNAIPAGNVLPDSIRKFEHEIDGVGSFGRFKIEANLSYGDGSSIISVTDSFWVLPWIPILIGLAVIVAVIFGATRGLRAYNRSVVKRSRRSS